MSKVNWSKLNSVDVIMFANGAMSGRSFYKRYANTPSGGMVRNMLRERGVDGARKIAQNAKRRLLANAN
jgi:hypothetical protein